MKKRLKKNNVKNKRNSRVIKTYHIGLLYSIHFLYFIEAKKKAGGKGPLKLGK